MLSLVHEGLEQKTKPPQHVPEMKSVVVLRPEELFTISFQTAREVKNHCYYQVGRLHSASTTGLKQHNDFQASQHAVYHSSMLSFSGPSYLTQVSVDHRCQSQELAACA
jgi:hypothetical protein